MEQVRERKNIVPFDGQKYTVWKKRVRGVLDECDLLAIIDDVIPEPITEEWTKKNRRATSIIMNYLSDSFLSYVEDGMAKEIFTKLDGLYERKTQAGQLAFRRKLYNLKYNTSTPLINHFKEVDELIEELVVAGDVMNEMTKISHLLMTMPKSYEGVITAIETLTEEISLDFVKIRLLDHEVKLLEDQRDTSAKVLLVKDYKNKVHHFQKRRPFPPRGNFKKTTDKRKCHHCGRVGHLKRDCFYYKGKTNNKNHQSNRGRYVKPVRQQEDEPNASNAGIAFMLGVSKVNATTGPENIHFILDSGASDHIVNREDLCQDFATLTNPSKISVAKNGQHITATKKGSLDVITSTGHKEKGNIAECFVLLGGSLQPTISRKTQ